MLLSRNDNSIKRWLITLSAIGTLVSAGHSGAADSSALITQVMGHKATGQPPSENTRHPQAADSSNQFLPNDPLSEKQWSFMADTRYAGAADIFSAQINNAQSAEVVVAVVDSGVILNHEDYSTLSGYDFVSDPVVGNDGDARDSDPSDPGDWVEKTEDLSASLGTKCQVTASQWHGTAIAGIIGAHTENHTGIAGAARRVSLLPVRVTGKCGGYVHDLIDGIRWAAGLGVAGAPKNHNPARIINLSIGFPGPCSRNLQSAIDAAVNAGAILVTAATNSGANLDVEPYSPASCRNIITVGASLRNGATAAYSATGSNVFMLGPGGSVYDGIISTDNSGEHHPEKQSTYGFQYGTSIAAAHVSATLATLLSAEPDLNNKELLTALWFSATPTYDRKCSDDRCGAGLLNTNRAIKTLMQDNFQSLLEKLPDNTPPAFSAALPGVISTGSFPPGALMFCLIILLLKLKHRRPPT